MTRRLWSCHFLLRLLVAANFAFFAAMLYTPFLRWMSRSELGRISGRWLVASTVILPLFAILQLLFMRGKVPGKTLWLDVTCAAVWFCFFWAVTLFGLAHYVPF